MRSLVRPSLCARSEALAAFIGLGNAISRRWRLCTQYRYSSSSLSTVIHLEVPLTCFRCKQFSGEGNNRWQVISNGRLAQPITKHYIFNLAKVTYTKRSPHFYNSNHHRVQIPRTNLQIPYLFLPSGNYTSELRFSRLSTSSPRAKQGRHLLCQQGYRSADTHQRPPS